MLERDSQMITPKLVMDRSLSQFDILSLSLNEAGVKHTLVQSHVGPYLVLGTPVEPDTFLKNKHYYKYLAFNHAGQLLYY